MAQGLRELMRDGQLGNVPVCIARLEAALQPVAFDWLVDRLGLLWNAMGHSRDPKVSAAWLHETTRLLSDLPGDIAADAIDEAVKHSERGFMPSVGEIRKIADPMVAKRKRALVRLNAVVSHQATKPREVARPNSRQIADILRQAGFSDLAAKYWEGQAR